MAEDCQIQLRCGCLYLPERDRQNRLTNVVHDLDHEGVFLLGGETVPTGHGIIKNAADFQSNITGSRNVRQVKTPRILDAAAVAPNKEAIMRHPTKLVANAKSVMWHYGLLPMRHLDRSDIYKTALSL